MEAGGACAADGRVEVQVTVADGYHVSGGPFCCFVRVAPIASDAPESDGPQSDEPVTVDFISLSVYGLASFRNRVLETSRLQSNLHFGFLKEARRDLRVNEGVHLIFASDPAICCACTDVSRASPELYYRFTCTIPPFVPPTVNSDNISCNYYVDVTVQCSAGLLNPLRTVLRRRLEFHVVGSVYPGVPTLEDAFYPILPVSGGYRLAGGRVDDTLLSKVCLDIVNGHYGHDNMFFNFNGRIESLDGETAGGVSDDGEADYESILEPVSTMAQDTFLLSRDLNAFWHIWDAMNGSGFQHEPEESYVLRRYNRFVERLTDLVLNDPTGAELEQYRQWFGGLFQHHRLATDVELPLDSRHELLQLFVSGLESRLEKVHGTSLDQLLHAAGDSLEVQREIQVDDSIKTMGFSLEGKSFCTCSLQGFSRLAGAHEFTLPLNSWFSIFFDFPDAFRCLHVEVSLVRTDTAGVASPRTSEVHVLQRSLYTLGKSQSNLALFVPMHTTPTFSCSFLNVSYRVELRFYYFEDSAGCPRAGLNRLRMLRWDHPVRLLPSESLAAAQRCAHVIRRRVRDSPVPDLVAVVEPPVDPGDVRGAAVDLVQGAEPAPLRAHAPARRFLQGAARRRQLDAEGRGDASQAGAGEGRDHARAHRVVVQLHVVEVELAAEVEVPRAGKQLSTERLRPLSTGQTATHNRRVQDAVDVQPERPSSGDDRHLSPASKGQCAVRGEALVRRVGGGHPDRQLVAAGIQHQRRRLRRVAGPGDDVGEPRGAVVQEVEAEVERELPHCKRWAVHHAAAGICGL
ncbi:ABC transporter [Babesia caballi]|uniref:ABC transporter n=1 Tax=Babesia caballi TaxID=5871 RepID=A0AAV4M150_BABCB|nr:ABC transporter [Babesia caballi]